MKCIYNLFLLMFIFFVMSCGKSKSSHFSTQPQIVVGGSHTCVLSRSGYVKCWGSNQTSQLGSGNEDSKEHSTPVDVTDLRFVKRLSAGGSHTCALMGNGKVKCWGANFSGALGKDTHGPLFSVPVEVADLGNVKEISASDSTTCAVTGEGLVKCWGNNDYGKLGNGKSSGESWIPSVVLNLSDAIHVSVGHRHACAITKGGNVKCWGLYQHQGASETQAVEIPTLSDVIEVAAGEDRTCVITSDHRVKCWGYLYHEPIQGLSGPGPLSYYTQLPVDQTGVRDAIKISVGTRETCIINKNQESYCWGPGFYHLPSPAPAPYAQFNDRVIDISVGVGHFCVITGSGSVKCQGYNGAGQVGVSPDVGGGVLRKPHQISSIRL